jgi:hypothetical protein
VPEHGVALIPCHGEGGRRSAQLDEQRGDRAGLRRRRCRRCTEVENVDAPNGRVKITITQAVYDAIGRYATRRFYEGTVFDYPLIEQPLIKA